MTNKRLLIADDEQNMLNSIMLILKAGKYEVSTAKNGRDALDNLLKAKKNHTPFDLLVTDIQMPGLTGVDLIDEIHRLNMNIPTLVITGYGDKKLVIELMRKGCEEYIDKPFTRDDLLKRVSIVLENDEQKKLIAKQRIEKNECDKARLNTEIELYKQNFDELQQQVNSAIVSYNDLIRIDKENCKINIAYQYRPLSYLGGDFIGVMNTSQGCDILMADVSGHDMGASYHTVLIKALFENNARKEKNGYLFFCLLNKALHEAGKLERMVTAAFLRFNLEKMEVEIVSAAHPPIIYLSSAIPAPCPILVKGNVLGVNENVDFDSRTVQIMSGDRFFLHSDGFSNAYYVDGPTGAKKKIETSEIDRLILKHKDLLLEEQTNKIWEEVMILCRNKPHDDMTLLTAEIPEIQNV